MRRFPQKKIRKKRLQSRQDRIMTLANFISFSRIILSIPLLLLHSTPDWLRNPLLVKESLTYSITVRQVKVMLNVLILKIST